MMQQCTVVLLVCFRLVNSNSTGLLRCRCVHCYPLLSGPVCPVMAMADWPFSTEAAYPTLPYYLH